jgi:hypothetical protein
MTLVGVCIRCGIRWLMSVIGINGNTQCPECRGTIEPAERRIYDLFPGDRDVQRDA